MQTVKVAHPTIEGDFMVINAEDFNPQLHKAYEEPKKKATTTKKKGADEASTLLGDLPTGEGDSDAPA